MDNILKISELMQKKARKIIEDTRILEIWSSIGATINPVGSMPMDLMMKNRDIDFHIYTDSFSISESFSAISALAQSSNIYSISYKNMIDQEDQCIEWHAFFKDEAGEEWQIDMIHILKDSPFAGYFEKVADRIKTVLTPETKEAILRIKNTVPDESKVMGIEIYRAVIEHGIRDTRSFMELKARTPDEGIITWMP